MVKVVFFAALRERLGCAGTEVKGFTGPVHSLLAYLHEQNPDWTQWLQSGQLLCAVNHQLKDLSSEVKDGDEVAFFPPVTGG